MEQWNIWLNRDIWLNVAIVLVATALIYSVLRTLVNTLHKVSAPQTPPSPDSSTCGC